MKAFRLFLVLAAILAGCAAPTPTKAPEDSARFAALEDLNRRVGELHQAGEYAKAAPVAVEAVRVAEETAGRGHPFVPAGLLQPPGLPEAPCDHPFAPPPPRP